MYKIIGVCLAFLLSTDLVFAQRRSSFPSRSSYPNYSSMPNGGQLSQNEVNDLMSQLKGCMWVDSLEESTEPSDASAYQVQGCKGPNGQNTHVCTGTLKCAFNLSGGGATSIFFENVMCGGNGNKCPSASDCLKDGGALKSVSLRENGGQQIIRPSESAKGVQ